MKDKFIEHALPLEEISEHSAHEKNVHIGLPAQFSIWWARRPLSSTRATSFAALVDDPGEEDESERAELYNLIKDISPLDSVKQDDSQAVRKAQSIIKEDFNGERPDVLDPFAGGGTIPLETLRLGCNTYSSDYNPVSVLIQKATVEWPSKYGFKVPLESEENDEGELLQTTLGTKGNHSEEKLLSFVTEHWANELLDQTRKRIGEFYPEESGENLVGTDPVENDEGWIPVSYIWARVIPCQTPTCNAELPLISQYWLARKSGKRIAYRPVVDKEREEISFEIIEGEELEEAIEEGFSPADGTISNGDANCPVCNQVTEVKKIRKLGKEDGVDQRLIAVSLYHPDETGKKYRIATDQDKKLFDDAAEEFESLKNNWPYMDSPIPDEDIPEERAVGNSGFRILLYGIDNWEDVFNDRQKLFLATFIDVFKSNQDDIEEYCNQLVASNELEIDPDQFSKVVIGSIGLFFNKTASFTTNLNRWECGSEIVKTLFDGQTLPMRWDYAEVNPFSESTGSAATQLRYMLAYWDSNTAELPQEPNISIQREDATQLHYEDNSFDAVLTDPPYYANFAYGDLSEFYYAWLKRSIGNYYPELFSTVSVEKTNEAIVDPNRGKNDAFYEEKLTESFSECVRVLKPGGVAVVVYAHKTTEGWETMLNALLEAGFVVTGSWPVHTEMKSRLVAARSAALASSIYMVCRKTERNDIGYWSDIKPDIEERIEEKLEQFWKNGIVGGDFFISSIGPGMEEFSKYERVETYSGEKVATEELLEFIRSVSTDFLVDRLLQDASSERIDEPAMFYLTYRWTYMDNKVEFDDARKLASAEGVDLEQLWGDGGFVKKTRKYIRVHGPDERDEIDRVDNMVDTMHKAAQLWKSGDKDELGEFLSSSGYGDIPAFWQFCQAVSECLVNGSKEKQMLEGLLMAREDYSDYSSSQTDTTLEDFATEGEK